MSEATLSPVRSLQRSRIKWMPLPRSDEKSGPAIQYARETQEAALDDLPDLLHPEPRFMIDREVLASQLAFSFAGGDASDHIRRVLADVATAPSDWRAESFAKHLFVDDFI